MQKAFINTLYSLAQADPKLVWLNADNGTDYDYLFYRELPEQYINVGISEENMVGMSAGLAMCGKIPFIFTGGAFLAYRALEFIRDDICLQNQNVKIIGFGSGISISKLGPTHHTTEDIGILKVLPNITILSPATPWQVQEAVKKAYELYGPVYIRIGMIGELEIEEVKSFEIGKNEVIMRGKDIVIFSTGSILAETLKAAKILKQYNIECEIVNVSTIKPFDKEQVLKAAGGKKVVVTVEEHNVIGGLGSIIKETIADLNCKKTMLKIGLEDCFAEGYGNYHEIKRINKLDAENIFHKIKDVYFNLGV